MRVLAPRTTIVRAIVIALLVLPASPVTAPFQCCDISRSSTTAPAHEDGVRERTDAAVVDRESFSGGPTLHSLRGDALVTAVAAVHHGPGHDSAPFRYLISRRLYSPAHVPALRL